MPEPTQPPTPDLTPAKESSILDETPSKPPKQNRPQQPTRTDSEVSTTSEMADSGDDTGYQSRSRSQSRRRRRQNQRQRQAASKAEVGAGGANAQSMAALQEEEEEPVRQLRNPHPSDTTEMQPFERIKPPSESMNGPVTYARAMRGEIPMRGKAPSMPLDQTQGVDASAKGGQSDMMAQDGLKLRLELNLDIEIELKASIHGDLTLAIMS